MARKMTRDNAKAFYSILAAGMPEPKTELNYSSPYTLLVAVVLSAQATDVGVNKATDKLFPVADTPEKILALGVDKLGDYIKTIGLWRGKAKNVIKLSQILLEEYNGEVPSGRDILQTLPGVGRKTANVVCNVVFGQPTMAVDTHIFRIGNRTRIAPGKTPLEVERGLERITPDEYMHHAHHWLILHGRYVCKARTPECWRCPVKEYCLYKDKIPDGGPVKTKKIKAKKAESKKSTKKKPTKKLSNTPKLRESKSRGKAIKTKVKKKETA